MTRRPNERDLARAEENARHQTRTVESGRGARAQLVAKFEAMAAAQHGQDDRLREQGIEPPTPNVEDHRVWAEQWEAEAVERVREAQQRMIDRATGELGYVSAMPAHVTATYTGDLSEVEGAKIMLGVARKMRRHLEGL